MCICDLSVAEVSTAKNIHAMLTIYYASRFIFIGLIIYDHLLDSN